MYVIITMLSSVFFAFRFYLTKTLPSLLFCLVPLGLMLLACIIPLRLYRAVTSLTFLGFCGYSLMCHFTTVIPDASYLPIAGIWAAMAIHALFFELEEEPANEPCKKAV